MALLVPPLESHKCAAVNAFRYTWDNRTKDPMHYHSIFPTDFVDRMYYPPNNISFLFVIEGHSIACLKQVRSGRFYQIQIMFIRIPPVV